jgi:hypothetical protein
MINRVSRNKISIAQKDSINTCKKVNRYEDMGMLRIKVAVKAYQRQLPERGVFIALLEKGVHSPKRDANYHCDAVSIWRATYWKWLIAVQLL